MYQVKALIVFNRKINKDHYLLQLRTPDICRSCLPGQFVLVQPDKWSTFLRRPFSIHYVDKLNLFILYKVVGKGTHIMSEKKDGEYFNIIGPLGQGFKIISGDILLIGGGCGVAPLLFLAHRIERRKSSVVLLGAKSKKTLLCDKDFREMGYKVKISTEDGSYGKKGKATDLLKNLLTKEGIRKFVAVYASGPWEMLKSTFKIAEKKGIPCQVSLEENMACGVGACMGCVVKFKQGEDTKSYSYKRVCKDGPVFDASNIVWD